MKSEYSEYRKAFTELYEILKLMPQELLDKIPSKFLDMIEDERDKEYFITIKEPLEEQNLKNETIIILGLIYRDFLCSPEEKKRLQERDAKELQEAQKSLEEELRKKYNSDDIFKNKQDKPKNKQVKENRLTVIQEEKWYKKIFNIIKDLFNRKY